MNGARRDKKSAGGKLNRMIAVVTQGHKFSERETPRRIKGNSLLSHLDRNDEGK